MERLKKLKKTPREEKQPEGDKKPVWKKVTRGTLYPFPNQRKVKVNPNETISASEEEIAKYREHFELVEDGTGDYIVKTVVPTKPDLEFLKRLVQKEEVSLVPIGQGLYNVESPAGKVINDKGLKLEDAQALKASLEEVTLQE